MNMMGIEGYLPLCRTVRQWKDRKKKIDIPLFPCYLFVKSNGHDPQRVLTLKGAVRFIKKDGQPAIIDQREIDQIRKLEEGDPEISNESFIEGEQVLIVRGPLRGLNGTITTIKGRIRLHVAVKVLNKYVLVDVSSADVKLSESASC
jgi:transcription antitermination factor NusG